MIRSMTGFGRSEITVDGKTISVEIKSVNHKYLDVSMRMPKVFNIFETKIREYLKDYIERGKVDIFINYKCIGTDNKKIILDEQLAEEYVDILQKMKEMFNFEDKISLSLVSRYPDIITVETQEENEDELWNFLEKPLTISLQKFVEMRETEGENLKKDLEYRLDLIEKLIKDIEEKSQIVVEEYRQKLNARISELLENSPVDEQRIALEVAIMSDKSNVTEEVVRLNSHIKQTRDTLNSKEMVGKKLNFIVQEMNREANTINSKANGLEIINNILQVKCEIEKIREQIQNVE